MDQIELQEKIIKKKKELESLYHRWETLSKKNPARKNIIFTSLQRHGISWIIRTLSNLHEAEYHEPIHFGRENAEISFLKATRNRFPLHRGWNNVYDVHPQALLDKRDREGNQYDRVILVQRKDRDDLEKDILKYWKAQGVDDVFAQTKLLPDFHKKYEKIYEIEDPKDPRFKRVYLEDLNTHAYHSFKQLMEHVGFPKDSKAVPVPIREIKRNWHVYSSILNPQEGLCGVLQKIEKMDYEKPKETKILLIGPQLWKGVHLSENLYYSYRSLGIDVELIPCENLEDEKSETFRIYKRKEKTYKVSDVIKKASFTPSLIIIDEPIFYFEVDVTIPTLYIHREYKRPPTVYYPTIAFFWHQGVKNYFRNLFAPNWAVRTKDIQILPIAVDIERYFPQKKIIKGIRGLAGREKLRYLRNLPEILSQGILKETWDATNEVLQYIPIIKHEQGLTDEEFRKYLPQMEALWCHIPLRQYVSRRILQAMACKTVVIMKIENEEHERVLESMGFKRGVHYIGMDEYSELKLLTKCFRYKDYKTMVEVAYDVIKSKHTYLHRAKKLLEIGENIV